MAMLNNQRVDSQISGRKFQKTGVSLGLESSADWLLRVHCPNHQFYREITKVWSCLKEKRRYGSVCLKIYYPKIHWWIIPNVNFDLRANPQIMQSWYKIPILSVDLPMRCLIFHKNEAVNQYEIHGFSTWNHPANRNWWIVPFITG